MSADPDADDLDEATDATVTRLDGVKGPANRAGFLLLRSVRHGETMTTAPLRRDTFDDIRRRIAEIAQVDPQKAAELGVQASHAQLVATYTNQRDRGLAQQVASGIGSTSNEAAMEQQQTEEDAYLLEALTTMRDFDPQTCGAPHAPAPSSGASGMFGRGAAAVEAAVRRSHPRASDEDVQYRVAHVMTRVAHVLGERR